MKPFNIAILGAGAIAGHMASAVRMCPEEFRPWAVAARDEDRARAFAEEYGFARAYGSYEAMLADPEVDLVYVALPHALHCSHALMCLEAGKNVVVEKPFTANAKEAEAVIEKARAKGLMAAEGIWTRYLPNVEKIQALVASGAIGEVRMLSGEIGYHLTQPRLFDPALAGGALLDIGVYAVALAGLVFGYDVESLSTSAQLTDRGVDETNSFAFRYKGGKMAAFNTSMSYMSSCRGTIWGSQGYADIDNLNRLSTVRVFDSKNQEIVCYTNPPCENNYVYEVHALYKALQEKRLDTPQATHEEILQRMGLMDALRKAWGMAYPFEK